MLVEPAEVFKLAPIAVVMQFCSLSSVAKQLHLNGKRVAHF